MDATRFERRRRLRCDRTADVFKRKGGMSLSSGLHNAASAQRAFSQAIETIQNNVDNIYTPGYTRLRPTFVNAPFNPDQGLPGGIRSGVTQDARSRYADDAV